MEMIETTNDFVNYSASGYTESNCADITFLNSGALCNVIINNSVTLMPGQSITLTANRNELDTTKYNFTFVPTAAFPLLSLNVIRRKYQVKDYSQKKKYYNDFMNYSAIDGRSNNNYIESNCGDITFYVTNGFVVINNAIGVVPGQFFSFRTNEEEIDKTKYYLTYLSFGNTELAVIRKKYI